MSDIEAQTQGVSEPDWLSYADFGQRFFELAVTQQRVLHALRSLPGRPVEFGPVGVGPVGLVKVAATGQVGEPTLVRAESELVAFVLTIPVDLTLVIDLGLEKSRFTAAVNVRLDLTARAAAPLSIVIDVQTPTARNVDVDVKADGLRASVLQVIGRVDSEIRKAVARYVAREISKPELEQARVIDVARVLAAY